MADEWIPPKGYTLCGGKDSTACCGRPMLHKPDGGKPYWACDPTDKCKATADKCACYLVVVEPGSRRLRPVPDGPNAKLVAETIPPGWRVFCICMSRADDADDHAWEGHEDLAWVAPDGYSLSKNCPSACDSPQVHWTTDLPPKKQWFCRDVNVGGDPNCYLVGVPPDEHNLHFMARRDKYFNDEEVPPGWAIMCVCMSKK